MFYPIAFNKLFHPSDFSESDENAFLHTLRIAVAARAQLDLLHVNASGESSDWKEFPGVREALIRWGYLTRGSDRTAIAGLGLEVKKAQRGGGGRIDEKILAYLEEDAPDLMVLSTHQRKGPAAWVHSALAERLARKSKTLTLFVPRRVQGFVSPDSGAISLRNILIPIDHEPNPSRAIEAAIALADVLGITEARFSLFHVGDETDAPEPEFPERAGWRVDRSCWEGDVVSHILDVAEERHCDLIVVPTRGRHGPFEAWTGSVSERILRNARSPLLAVPAE